MELRALADRPFELLAALETRLIGSGDARMTPAGGAEWTGLAFQLGDERYLAPRADVREVMEPPSVTRVPGARPWLVGIANVRGELLPVVDLTRLVTGQPGRRTEASRVIVLNDDAVAAGCLVDGVAGFRGVLPEEQRHELAATPGQGADADADIAAFVLGAFVRDGSTWRVFSLRKLAAAPVFRDAGA